jgi:hypothetical protein
VGRAKRLVDAIIAFWPTRPSDPDVFLREFLKLIEDNGGKLS